MDRRSILAFASALPAFAVTPASACSFALTSPRSTGLENQQVKRLFEAWWQRDKKAFRELFTKHLMADGSTMERDLAKDLAEADPIPVTMFDIYDKLFTVDHKVRRMVLIVNTAAGILAACSEEDSPNSTGEVIIGADCSGTPSLYLFHILMSGLNPRSVTHLATVATPEPSKFSVWAGD
jgi:hypothetical protein